MLQFDDPITADTVLIRPAIQSPNYVPGVSGWAVFIDGSAEFNNVTARGTLEVDAPNLPPLTGSLIGKVNAAYPNSSNLSVLSLSASETTSPNTAALLIDALNKRISTVATFVLGDAYNGAAAGQQLAFIPPSGNTTGATDGAVITAALAVGWAVTLLPGIYYVNAPVSYPAGAVIRGAGPAGFGLDSQTTIKATAAMPAVLASTGWATAANTAAQTAVTLADFNVDGSNLATHGIVTQNYDSNFDRLNVQNVTGDGLRMDAFSSNGAAQITTSGVANRVTRCTFQNAARGLATNEAASGGAVYTDGFAADNLVDGASGTGGITIQRAAGWVIRGNHLYGCQQNGIQAGQMFATRITENYVETWGGSAAANFYGAIDGFSIGQSDDGPVSIIAGNTLNMFAAPGNAGSTILGVGLNCLAGNSMHFAVTGNGAWCQPAAGFAAADAFRYANINNTSTTVIASTGNLATGNWTAAIAQVPNGGAMTVTAGV